jgi:arylformamidase
MPGTIVDITRPLGPTTPVWPGDEPFEMRWSLAPGDDVAAVSCLRFSPHLGTHLDAPLHLDARGPDVATVPLSVCFGPCEVVALPGHDRPILRRDLPSRWTPSAPRVLFATGTWPVGAEIPPRFGSVSPDLADALALAGVLLVGIDTPSVDEPEASELPTHGRCLAHAIAILEGLDLTGVAPGRYTLVAAPLRLVGVEASPVRAFLLPLTVAGSGTGDEPEPPPEGR